MSEKKDKIKAFFYALSLVICEIFHLLAGSSVCENERSLTLYKCDVAALGLCIWKMTDSCYNKFKEPAETFLKYINDLSGAETTEWPKNFGIIESPDNLEQFCEKIFQFAKFKVTKPDIPSVELINSIKILGVRCENYANALYLIINSVILHTIMNTCPEKRKQTYLKLFMCAFSHNGLGVYFEDDNLTNLLDKSKKNIIKIEREVYEHLQEREGVVEARLFNIFGRSYHLAQSCATLGLERLFVSCREYKPGVVLCRLLGAGENTSVSPNAIGDILENFYVILERVCSTV